MSGQFLVYCISAAHNKQNITKIRLFKYIKNFTTKNLKFSEKNILIIFILLLIEHRT